MAGFFVHGVFVWPQEMIHMHDVWLALWFFPGFSLVFPWFFPGFSRVFLLQSQSLNPSIRQAQSPFF